MPFGTTSNDVYLIKTDANGNKSWEKTSGGSYDDGGRSVQQTADGGYIIAGSTKSFGDRRGDVYLIYHNPDRGEDTDKDGISNSQDNCPAVSNPTQIDTDGDGDGNACDSDDDDDGMPDEWEEQYGLDPLTNDASKDFDGDGLTNYDEYKSGSDPTRPESQATPIEKFVTRFYNLCLDREPDKTGLDGWVDGLLDGSLTGSDVAYGFVFSPEFLERNAANDEYLGILYEAFFNRKPDQAGWAGWLAELNSGTSREVVLNGFIHATEFNELCREYRILPNPVAAFVTRFYQLCLKRDPDIAGLDGWVASLLNGTNVGADVAEGFIFSPEFTKNLINDDEYIRILYKAFFNRDPDAAGLAGWLDALNSGKTREEVLDGFISTPKNLLLCVMNMRLILTECLS